MNLKSVRSEKERKTMLDSIDRVILEIDKEARKQTEDFANNPLMTSITKEIHSQRMNNPDKSKVSYHYPGVYNIVYSQMTKIALDLQTRDQLLHPSSGLHQKGILHQLGKLYAYIDAFTEARNIQYEIKQLPNRKSLILDKLLWGFAQSSR
jgi:hypothetical protein